MPHRRLSRGSSINKGQHDVAKKSVTSHSNVLHVHFERSARTGAPAESALSRRCACRLARNVSFYGKNIDIAYLPTSTNDFPCALSKFSLFCTDFPGHHFLNAIHDIYFFACQIVVKMHAKQSQTTARRSAPITLILYGNDGHVHHPKST